MKLRLPHPFVLFLGAVAVAALLTWILPAGEYQRRTDAATGGEVVVAGTYARVAAAPVGLKAALLAVPRAIIAGADVILTILFVGGFLFYVSFGYFIKWFGSYDLALLPVALMLATGAVIWLRIDATEDLIPETPAESVPQTAVPVLH